MLLRCANGGKTGRGNRRGRRKRRFRANAYVDLTNANGFAEDKFVGRSLRIGSKVTVAVLQRDARCMMITLDPDTAAKTPAILKAVAQAHEGMAGVYGAVLVEGMIGKGDPVELLNQNRLFACNGDVEARPHAQNVSALPVRLGLKNLRNPSVVSRNCLVTELGNKCVPRSNIWRS